MVRSVVLRTVFFLISYIDVYIISDGIRYRYGAVTSASFKAADLARSGSMPAFVRIDLSIMYIARPETAIASITIKNDKMLSNGLNPTP